MAKSSLGSPVVGLTRFAAYLAFTLPLMPVQAMALVLGSPLCKSLPHWYHRKCCRIQGIKIELRGRRSRQRPTLFVANHVSYFDISVISALVPVSFIAKSEVARWPFFGSLAKLQRTVFVERRRGRVAEQRNVILERLQEGSDLVLFAEGTSGDGNRVLPFKSALFSVAEQEGLERPLTIQPVSITYTRLDGLPMGRYLRPLFAWYGDMELFGHLLTALGMGVVTVVVEFHPPVTMAQFGSRKALSDHCQREVGRGVAAALSGRKTPKAPKGALPGPGPRPEVEGLTVETRRKSTA